MTDYLDIGVVRIQSGGTQKDRFVGLAQAVPYEAIQDRVAAQGRSILWLVLLLSGVAAGLASVFSLVLTRPLKRITQTIRRLGRDEAGAELPLPLRDHSEIGVLARSFHTMVEQARERRRELQQSETLVLHDHDPLIVQDR